jgi:hypothetical protein
MTEADKLFIVVSTAAIAALIFYRLIGPLPVLAG